VIALISCFVPRDDEWGSHGSVRLSSLCHCGTCLESRNSVAVVVPSHLPDELLMARPGLDPTRRLGRPDSECDREGSRGPRLRLPRFPHFVTVPPFRNHVRSRLVWSSTVAGSDWATAVGGGDLTTADDHHRMPDLNPGANFGLLGGLDGICCPAMGHQPRRCTGNTGPCRALDSATPTRHFAP